MCSNRGHDRICGKHTFHKFLCSNKGLPPFEALETGMNEAIVDTEDVEDKVDRKVQTLDIKESLEDRMKHDIVKTEYVEKHQ